MIADLLMKLGSFDVSLEALPDDLRERITYFGHMAFVPGAIDVRQYGDELLEAARYVGVVRGTETEDDTYKVSGTGMAVWLGDEDDKGHVYETAREYDNESFANTLRDLLPPSVSEGTLHSIPGSYTGRHIYVSPRNAIDYVCETFNAEWRVNGDGSFDAGEPDDLFNTGQGIIVRKGAGEDVYLKAHKGDIKTEADAQDYTTRVILLAEGEGEEIKTGDAEVDSGDIAYRDINGNLVKFTRIIGESETSEANASTRALLQLNRFRNPRQSLKLSAEDYDFEGAFRAGDTVYVYDPDAGLIGDEQIEFRGQLLPCTTLRVVGVRFPVLEGLTVAYRDADGQWVDLTPYVQFEAGEVEVTVGATPRSLTNSNEDYAPRVNAPSPDVDDGIAPGQVSVVTPFDTYAYLASDGTTRAAITVEWNAPNNADGSTFDDGSYYEVRFRETGSTGWSRSFVGADALDVTLLSLETGAFYEAQVRAVDVFGNLGEWSVLEETQAEADDIAPSTPAAPSVSGGVLRIFVTHTLGKSTGGTYNLETDLDHLELHASDSDAFTPSDATKISDISANASHLRLEVPVVADFGVDEPGEVYVRVIAVDRAGNASAPSAPVPATAVFVGQTQIGDGEVIREKIADNAVNRDKVLDGEIVETKIGDGAISTPKLEANAVTAEKILAGEIDATHLVTDTAVITGAAQIQSALIDTVHITDAAIKTAKIDDLAVNGAKIANLAVDTAKIADLAVNDAKISSLTADKITAGTIDGSVINVTNIDADNISTGTLGGARLGNGSIAAIKLTSDLQSDNYVAGSSGWRIRRDTGDVEFEDGVFRGDIVGGTINIGDSNDFHVGSTGLMWIGNSSYSSAPFRVSNGGYLFANNANITGNINATGGFISGILEVTGGLQIGGISLDPNNGFGEIRLGGIIRKYGDFGVEIAGDPVRLRDDVEVIGDLTVSGTYDGISISNRVINSVNEIRADYGSSTDPPYTFTGDHDSGLFGGAGFCSLAAAGNPLVVAYSEEVQIRTGTRYSFANGWFEPYDGGNPLLGRSASNRRWDRLYSLFSPNVSSDARLKRDVEDTPLGLDFVNSLRPVQYRGLNGVRLHQGLIAQEVGQAVVDAGYNLDDFSPYQRTGVDGEDTDEDYLGLVYEEFISIALKAIQELSARLAVLEDE